MLKLLAVCLFAFAIAKWNQRVQATEELDAEEKRLLQEIQSELGTRDYEQCSTQCPSDDECHLQCCIDDCNDMDCVAMCYGDQDKRETDITDLRDDEVNQQKKAIFIRRGVRIFSRRRRTWGRTRRRSGLWRRRS